MKSDTVYLLDANVLIALLTPDHTFYERTRSWFGDGLPFATCPITQSALLRFHMRWSESPSIVGAKAILRGVCAHPLHRFWPDDVECLQIPERGVRGHRQVTDAYLAALAAAHNGVLATMDESLAALQKGVVLV
jgi:hypothetical protein